ncbi:MAG: hypothetical protein AAB288_09175 [Acidobacteriota bacterium]
MKSKSLLLAILLASVVGTFGQSRTNRIYRPCPATSAQAFVEIQRDGDVNIKPCPGRTLQQNDVAINVAQPFELIAAISDETTDLAVTPTALTFHIPRNFTAVEVWAGLTAVSSSGLVTVDINKNGVSIFSTTLTLDVNEETSLTAATAAVLTTLSFVKGDKITVDIDGAGTGAKGLKVYFLGTR